MIPAQAGFFYEGLQGGMMKRGYPPVEDNEVFTSYVARADPGGRKRNKKRGKRRRNSLPLQVASLKLTSSTSSTIMMTAGIACEAFLGLPFSLVLLFGSVELTGSRPTGGLGPKWYSAA